jgi:3-isopropylmalate/(R)-2-methylmalate dehydratase large subunit
MTAAEKILARASGERETRAGDIVYPMADFAMITTAWVMGIKQELDALGIDRLFDPDRVVMVTDHDVVYNNDRAVARGAFNRRAAQAWGVKQFYDAGRGGHGHIFPMERGLVSPGTFYFDNDRHCTNAGGIGALAIRVGADIASVLATGTTWTLVPKTVRLSIKGRLKPGVYGRDLGYQIGRRLRPGGEFGVDIDYRVLEFAGELDQFSLAQRVALCSTPTEMRAIGVFFPPSDEIVAYARERADRPVTPVYPDPDASYDASIEMDVSALEPQVALPGGPHRAVDLAEVAGTRVDHAFIGSCGSGMYEDLAVRRRILEGRTVAPGVRLLITPGSEDSTHRIRREGLLEIFQEAGAFVLPAGCGGLRERPHGLDPLGRDLDLHRDCERRGTLRREGCRSLSRQSRNGRRLGGRGEDHRSPDDDRD